MFGWRPTSCSKQLALSVFAHRSRRSPSRSHSVSSSAGPMRIEVLAVAPDAPDEAECLAHAMPGRVHLRLPSGSLALVVGSNDRIVLNSHDGHSIRGGPQM